MGLSCNVGQRPCEPVTPLTVFKRGFRPFRSPRSCVEDQMTSGPLSRYRRVGQVKESRPPLKSVTSSRALP